MTVFGEILLFAQNDNFQLECLHGLGFADLQVGLSENRTGENADVTGFWYSQSEIATAYVAGIGI